MIDDLPNDFDIVVIGTGFIESCIAAAASRIGKTVLHVDPNDFYGGSWASFNLENLNLFLETNKNTNVANATYKWYINDKFENAVATKDQILTMSRQFSLDLCPKILYSSGQLVRLLISSNICRYAEFRAVDRVLTIFNNELISVPCSRSDVFNTKHLNIMEKRMLMKFLNNCLAFNEDKCAEDFINFRDKTFLEYLRNQKLNDKIITCIVQAIAMCKTTTSFELGIDRTLNFLKSIGKYGNTPFLFPMYGCGEIPQCFCRLCAVYGGIYCLKRNVEDIVKDTQLNCYNVTTEKKVLRTKNIVISDGSIPEKAQILPALELGPITNKLSRGIILTTSPLGSDEINAGCGGVNLLRLSEVNDEEALLIQLSHFSGTCPKGFYIFHLTTTAKSSNPENDLKPFIDQVFIGHEITASIIYSAYFTITSRISNLKDNLCMVPIIGGADYELDYDKSLEKAREIFEKIFPSQEFLPRAPDPEEIVVDGEDPSALSENNLPEDLLQHLHT